MRRSPVILGVGGVLIAALMAVVLVIGRAGGSGSASGRDQTGAYVEAINRGLKGLGENCEPFPVGHLTTGQLQGLAAKMREFERVGLIKAQRYYSETGRALGYTTGYDVSLTPLGKRYYRPGQGFCYGTGVVTKVTRAVPNKQTGEVAVNYEFRLQPFPKWAAQVGIADVYEASVVLRPTEGGGYTASPAQGSP